MSFDFGEVISFSGRTDLKGMVTTDAVGTWNCKSEANLVPIVSWFSPGPYHGLSTATMA